MQDIQPVREIGRWFKYPQKPLEVTDRVFSTLDMGKYVLEPKLDGHRLLLIATPQELLCLTRENHRIEVPDPVRESLAALHLPEGTVLDGEIWNETKRGSWRFDRRTPCNLSFWDCIRHGHDDLSARPLTERRWVLEQLCPSMIVPQHAATKAQADAYRERAEEHKRATLARSGFIHGVVLKRKASPRRDHAVRSQVHPDWLKLVFWS